MGSAGNFHPEWGYLAPMPSFRRTLRIAVVAAAIGAVAGSVAGVSLISPSRSHVSDGPISARALMSSRVVVPSPAEAYANTTATPANAIPPKLALLLPDADESAGMTPADDGSRLPPAATASPERKVVAARKGPVRVHRSRVANGLRYPHYERGYGRPFQLPHNSTFVQLDQSCCAWTMPANQHSAPQW